VFLTILVSRRPIFKGANLRPAPLPGPALPGETPAPFGLPVKALVVSNDRMIPAGTCGKIPVKISVKNHLTGTKKCCSLKANLNGTAVQCADVLMQVFSEAVNGIGSFFDRCVPPPPLLFLSWW
jgi:hypothetical protein